VLEAAFRDRSITREQVDEVVQRHHLDEAVVSLGRSEQPWTIATITAMNVDEAQQERIQSRLRDVRGFDETVYEVSREPAAAAPGTPPGAPDTEAPAAPEAPDAAEAPETPAPAETPETPAPAETPVAGEQFRATAVFTVPVTQEDIRRAIVTAPAADERGLNLQNLRVETTEQDNSGENAIPVALIRSHRLDPNELGAVKGDLEQIGGGIIEPMYQANSIGPTIAREVTLTSIWAVIVASLFIVLYLALRFAIGGFKNGLKFGAGAIAALVHDVGIVIGLFALMGFLAGWQIDSYFVTAALAILGFSVNDTIVVYDRIRENLRNRKRGETFADIGDRSITQTFDRSLNTSLTVLMVIGMMVAFGGDTIRLFSIALLLGIAVGTYSSIFVATPLVVMMERAAARRAGRPEPEQQRPVRRAAAPAAPPRDREPAPVTSGATRRDAEPRPATPAGEEAPRADGVAKPGTIRPRKKRRM
jgi:preprotein translocase SecF subunit